MYLHLEKYRRNANYLSHHICDEFIKIISKNVVTCIIQEIISATYYNLILNSTSEISHIVIIRYVSSNGIKEMLLGFVPVEEYSSAYLAKQVSLILNKCLQET